MPLKNRHFSQLKSEHKNKDTFYAAFISLSKTDLIKGTEFVRLSFAQFGLEVHLGTRANNAKSKTEAMHFPSHSKLKNEIPQELIDGDFDIPNGKFVSFTNKFKYLGTYLSQNLSDDTDIELRITAPTKNLNALGRQSSETARSNSN
jgi:hypothetical protein